MDLEKFKEIKNVYRFFSHADYNFTGLAAQYLWCSKVVDFNDPFENEPSAVNFDISSLSKADVISFLNSNPDIQFTDSESGESYNSNQINLDILLEKQGSDVIGEINNAVINHAKKFQNHMFHCLSHDKGKIHPLKNRMLWSHYSSGLRGFVIEFDLDVILDSLKLINNNEFKGCSLINYLEHSSDLYVKELAAKGEYLNIVDLLFTKHPDWEYESELRLISSNPKLYYPSECISKIIIGDKMTPENRDNIHRISLSKGLESKLFVASIDRNSFSINVTRGLYKS